MINPLVSTLIKGMLYLILKAKQGGKYLSRKQVIDKRTGRKTWKYKYKPVQQRGAHEVTRSKFEKVTKLSGDEHKNQIEHALQNGVHVSLHVLRDYPDLIVKYHQQARIAKADKIRAKVKASKEKDLASLKKMASEYVDMKESSQVSKPTTENKGSEEKKMNEQISPINIKIQGSEKQISFAKDLIDSNIKFVNKYLRHKDNLKWKDSKESRVQAAKDAMSRFSEYFKSLQDGVSASEVINKLKPTDTLRNYVFDNSDLTFRLADE